MFYSSVVFFFFVVTNGVVKCQGELLRRGTTSNVELTDEKAIFTTDEVILFESSFSNRRETEITPVSFVVATNTIVISGKNYSLEGLEEFSVLSPDVVVMVDDPDLVESNVYPGTLWFGKDGETEIFVSKDENNRISLIDIFDGENSTSLVANYTTGEFDEVSEEDVGNNATIDEDVENPNDDDIPPFDQESLFMTQANCGKLRTIDVAIAVDSSFCQWVGGIKAAISRSKTIVAHASNKYRQQGVCLQLRLSAMDVRCQSNNDPYKNMMTWHSGCIGSSSTGFIRDFSHFWDSNMKKVPRDTAHLLTATKMDGPLGCSNIGTLCRDGAYGVDYMTEYSSINMQGVLLAHEIGHNAGATHVGGTGYIMNSNLSDGRYGFSPESIWQILQYINKNGKCIK